MLSRRQLLARSLTVSVRHDGRITLATVFQRRRPSSKMCNTLTGTAHPIVAVVYDMNGREASDTEPILAAVGDVEQYIFCSSAGVYLKSDQMPHMETDATDPNSRHKVEWQLQSPRHKACRGCRHIHAHTTVLEHPGAVPCQGAGIDNNYRHQGGLGRCRASSTRRTCCSRAA